MDNRSSHYKLLLACVTLIRSGLVKVRSRYTRLVITEILMWLTYLPFIGLGHILARLGLKLDIPLYDAYANDSFRRSRQDVYDRYFTRIEQRFTREQIMELKDTFKEINISDGIPYWHFICRRRNKIT